MDSMFEGCNNLTEIKINIEAQQLNNIDDMFKGCDKLESIIIKQFDAPNLKNMNGIFANLISLTNLTINYIISKNAQLNSLT